MKVKKKNNKKNLNLKVQHKTAATNIYKQQHNNINQ